MDIHNKTNGHTQRNGYHILHLTQLPWDSTPLKVGKSFKDSLASVRLQAQPQFLTLRFRRRHLSHRIFGFRPPRRYSLETRPLPHSKCEVWTDDSTTFFICQQNLNIFLIFLKVGKHLQKHLKKPFFLALSLSVLYNRIEKRHPQIT